MTLIEALKPRTFYETLNQVLRNYRNWQYYKRTIMELYKDGSLKQYQLRLDIKPNRKFTPDMGGLYKKVLFWLRPSTYRTFYVLNLEPETLMMGEQLAELERSRVYESLSMKKPMFEKADLGEIIEAKTERIKNEEYYAYIIQIKYRPSSTVWDAVYVGVWLIAIGAAVYGLSSLDAHYKEIYDWVSNLFTTK